jgi:hypothetical protein
MHLSPPLLSYQNKFGVNCQEDEKNTQTDRANPDPGESGREDNASKKNRRRVGLRKLMSISLDTRQGTSRPIPRTEG